MKALVSIAQSKDFTEESIRKATFDAIGQGGFELPRKVKSVILKVNLRYYWDYSTGETTDPRVASALVDFFRDKYGGDIDLSIAEADASAMRTKHAFRMLGYTELAKRKSVRLVNLCECEKVTRQVTVKGQTYELPIARQMLESDLLINVPKLRTHRLTTVSCALKNLFGAIAKPRKIEYHQHLNEVIVGINKLIRPNLAVVDGIIALGKNPIKMGLVLAGEDQLAVDSIAARIMGYNPRLIKNFTLAQKEGVGTLENIETVGFRDLGVLGQDFPKENYFLFNLLWDLKLRFLDAYLKITGDTRPPVLDK